MPFLAPLIGAAIGLGATGTAVLEIGLAVGLSFAARELRPKQKKSTAAESRGMRVGLTIDTNPDRICLLGEVATGGSLAYWQLSGTNNDILHMVVALADHECNSLQKVIVNGKEKAWNSGTKQVAGYGDKLLVRFYSGAAGQTADSEVISASGGRWTSNEKGTGVCYAVVKLTYDETLFPEGIPELGFVVRGHNALYDPRTGTSGYSDNAAVCLYNILKGVSAGGEPLVGMNVATSAIRAAEAQGAANACDEAVALKAGGTEKRYRCGVALRSSQDNRDMIEVLLAAMAGKLIETGGIYRMFAGVAQTPVAALTDADLITDEPLVSRPKRGRNELTNAIGGSFTSPAHAYAQVAVPLRSSSIDEAKDGGRRLTKTFDLEAVTSRTQAQRVLEVERRRVRRMASASMRVRARYFGLEPGDWVTFTSDRRGYDTKTFLLVSSSGNRDLTSDIVLVEIDDAIDDWTTSLEIDDNQVIDLASAGPSLSSVSGVTLAAVNLTATGAIKRPGLQMGWTPIDDPTVVELEIEFRKIGDTVALKTSRVLDPSVGTYTWVTGVQGGVSYEARVRPIARPARSVTWSAWVSASSTGDQVVPIAELATAVPPGTITPAMLDAQSQFELSLVTATDQALGSVAEQIAGLVRESERVSMAAINALLDVDDAKTQIKLEKIERVSQDLVLAQQITTISAQIDNDISAALLEEQTARATADSALSQQIATAVSRLDGNEVAVTVLQESINGLEGRWGIAINSNGQIVGLVQLDASAVAGSTFTVVAGSFRVASPGVSGGGAVPVFAISTVNGVTKLALRGDMLADGAIIARHISVASLSAISASLGLITAGLIRDAANAYFFNVPTGQLGSTDGKFLIDAKNKIIEIEF